VFHKEDTMATLVRWEPFRDLSGFQGDVSRLMSSLLDAGTADTAGGPRNWAPALDVWETETELVYAFDLPGVGEEGISIEAQDDTLTISGARERTLEDQGDRFYRFERRQGAFVRSVGLPAGVDDSKITASYRDGVLEVHVPKPVEAKPRRIQVGSAPADVDATPVAS
jgi:HSP20 family protein